MPGARGGRGDGCEATADGEGADLAEIGRAAPGGLADEVGRYYFPSRFPYRPFGPVAVRAV